MDAAINKIVESGILGALLVASWVIFAFVARYFVGQIKEKDTALTLASKAREDALAAANEKRFTDISGFSATILQLHNDDMTVLKANTAVTEATGDAIAELQRSFRDLSDDCRGRNPKRG